MAPGDGSSNRPVGHVGHRRRRLAVVRVRDGEAGVIRRCVMATGVSLTGMVAVIEYALAQRASVTFTDRQGQEFTFIPNAARSISVMLEPEDDLRDY